MSKEVILVINAGSSSIKYKVFDKQSDQVLASGQCEKIANPMGIFSIKINGKEDVVELPIPNHSVGIKKMLDELKNKNVISSLDEIKGIGHRVVMGGRKYDQSIVIDDDVLKVLTEYIPLAPLHNPPEIDTIKEFQKMLPNVKNIAVFDTSFHTSIPAVNNYALNQETVKKYGIYRYGMHGTSYRYITQHVQSILNKKDLNLIICHIGNGASMCCVKNSKSYDTTMGFTPLDGLVMGTRCGNADPSIALFLIRQGWTADQVDNMFNKQSGLKGFTGKNDFRDVNELASQGNEDAKLVIDMFINRVANYIAWYANELENKIDAIIFTAGVGENSNNTVKTIINKAKVLNLTIDDNAFNNKYSDYRLVSTSSSQVPVYQVRTDEELMIEQDVKSLAK